MTRLLFVLPLALAVNAACGHSERAAAESSSAAPTTRTPQQYSVEDFYKNTEYSGASWAPGNQKLLVSSNASGIWNAYSMPVAGGPLEPLTMSTTNSIVAISYFPADERVLYSSDEGGNELTHIYVRNTDGTTKDLTPGPKLKASFNGWAGDDKSFFVSTNERDARYFDLCEVSADKPARTTSDVDIFLHDRQSKATKNITEHTGTVNNTPAEFSPDGSKLLFVSDEGREFNSLRSYDVASAAKATVYEQPWDILGAEYVVRGVTMPNDESSIAFYASDGSVPADLYAGKISDETFEEWNRGTGSRRLPERVKRKTRSGSKGSRTRKRK